MGLEETIPKEVFGLSILHPSSIDCWERLTLSRFLLFQLSHLRTFYLRTFLLFHRLPLKLLVFWSLFLFGLPFSRQRPTDDGSLYTRRYSAISIYQHSFIFY